MTKFVQLTMSLDEEVIQMSANIDSSDLFASLELDQRMIFHSGRLALEWVSQNLTFRNAEIDGSDEANTKEALRLKTIEVLEWLSGTMTQAGKCPRSSIEGHVSPTVIFTHYVPAETLPMLGKCTVEIAEYEIA